MPPSAHVLQSVGDRPTRGASVVERSVGDIATEFGDLGHAAPTAQFEAAPPPGYAVERELGRGGMGVVYLATQTGLNRPVALKMILSGVHATAKEQARFLAEAEAVAALRHPHVVQIFETGRHGGLPYFTLEFCDGGGLNGKLADGPLPPREAADLVAKVADGVQAAAGQVLDGQRPEFLGNLRHIHPPNNPT